MLGAFAAVAQPNVAAMRFSGNVVAPSATGQPGPGKTFAGLSGREVANVGALKFTDPTGLNFTPKAGSPLLAAGVARTDLPGSSRDVGAFSQGAGGTPPDTGPQSTPSP